MDGSERKNGIKPVVGEGGEKEKKGKETFFATIYRCASKLSTSVYTCECFIYLSRNNKPSSGGRCFILKGKYFSIF
jgi:hypothetical protein